MFKPEMDVNVNLSEGGRVDAPRFDVDSAPPSSVDKTDRLGADDVVNPSSTINPDTHSQAPMLTREEMDSLTFDVKMGRSAGAPSPQEEEEDDDEDEEDDDELDGEGEEYHVHSGAATTTAGDNNGFDLASMMIPNMSHGFDDIQFFPSNRSLRLQPQFQFQDQLDSNNYMSSNFNCFDASGLVSLSGSGSVSNNFSLISDSTSGDINSAFSESPFVFPDNVMEYGEPQFFPGNCVGYLETILEEDDEEYEEEEGCSGRHWWTADSDTDTDSVIRVDNNGQQKPHCQPQPHPPPPPPVGVPGEKDEVKPHFRSSASSKPFELEDLHLFDQLDHAFEETLREPRRRAGFAFGQQQQQQSQSVEQQAEANNAGKVHNSQQQQPPTTHHHHHNNGVARCQKSGVSNESNTASSHNSHHHHVFIESTNNDDEEERSEMTTKGLNLLTQENVKAHSEENPKIIYTDEGSEKEPPGKKLGNAESRETFGSSLSPSSSDSEAPAEVAEEDFFYSSPGSEEEECRSQEGTESEESCSSDDSEKKGVVLAEFSLGSTGSGGSGGGSSNGTGFGSSSSGLMFGSSRSRRSFESPSRLKSFRSFDSLNCLAGTELLFSKPDTFPSIHHIKEVSEPGSESESSAEVSTADDRVIPEEDEEEEGLINHREGTQSLPSQHSASVGGFPGPSLNQQGNKNSASSSTSTVSSTASGSGLRSTENLSEDSGIGNDGISSTAASTPGAFVEETNVLITKSSEISPPPPNTPAEIEAGLTPDSSAKDYISRAEFALNPFVYSSLSSSESSSMNSAPSLSNTTPLTQLQPNLNSKSLLPTDHKRNSAADESLANGISREIEEGGSKNDQDRTASSSPSSSSSPQPTVSNSLEEGKPEEELKTSSSPSPSDISCNLVEPPVTSSSTSSSSSSCDAKHADTTSGSESGPDLAVVMMDDEPPPSESGGLHPQLNSVQIMSSSSSSSSRLQLASINSQGAMSNSGHHPNSPDCGGDKRELANNSNPDPTVCEQQQESTQPSGAITRGGTTTTTIVCSIVANSLVTKQTQESSSSPDRLRDQHVHPGQMGVETMIDGDDLDVFKQADHNNHHHHSQHNIISSGRPSTTTSSTQNGSHLICTSSSLPESSGSSALQTEKWAKDDSYSIQDEAPRSPPLEIFPTTATSSSHLDPNHHGGGYSSSSSSSSDEQSDSSHPPSRFLRQRSDSESEYEAAESAVERNNVDMAYDIIVNSPSKKQSVPGGSVTGATSVIFPTPTSCTSSPPPPPSCLGVEQGFIITTAAEDPSASASPSGMSNTNNNNNKCSGGGDGKSGPVSTLSSLISIHQNAADMQSWNSKVESNDKIHHRLPLFESSIDDYDEDDDDDVIDSAALPISKTRRATSSINRSASANDDDAGEANGRNNITACATTTTAMQPNSHEDGQHDVGRKQERTASSSSSSPHNENSSALLSLHHQLQNTKKKETENSDELTTGPSLPQLNNTQLASNSGGAGGDTDDDGEHRDVIVDAESRGSQRRNFVETQQTHQQHHHHPHHDHHNVLRSVTLDDSTSADVANLVRHHQSHKQNASSALPVERKSNRNHTTSTTTHSAAVIVDIDYKPGVVVAQAEGGHHNHNPNHHEPNKVVESCPNERLGVAQQHTQVVNKVLYPSSGPRTKECASSFSGPVEPSSTHPPVESENNNNNNKQSSSSELQIGSSQSVQSPVSSGRPTSSGSSASPSATTSSSSSISSPSGGGSSTTGKERVILGDSNFGFFGCSSHSRGRGAYESHEPSAVDHPASSSNVVFPRVNLDLHSISESGFSPGYGFPCSLPPPKDEDAVLPDEECVVVVNKQETTSNSNNINKVVLVPSSTRNNSSSNNNINSSIHQRSAPVPLLSSFAPKPVAAVVVAAELPKDSKQLRRDQQPKEHNIYRQQQQQHLHREESSSPLGLVAGLDKFSVPLGAIKAAVVGLAPAIPTYIVKGTTTGAGVREAQTAERRNASTSVTAAAAPTTQLHAATTHTYTGGGAASANGNLSTVFPSGTVKSCNSNSGAGAAGAAPPVAPSTLPRRSGGGGGGGGNKEGEQQQATQQQQPSSSSVPDILILKQFPAQCDNRECGEGERKIGTRGGVIMELEHGGGSANNSSSNIGGGGINSAGQNLNCGEHSSIVVVPESISEMHRDSPSPSSGLPLKTKTYGPRNEVEVVVVSSRTPSPAPGGFVVGSSTSSRKLPSSPSTSAGQERNEPASGSSSGFRREEESASRESSIPPPPFASSSSSSSSPPPPPQPATTQKATRSRVHFSPVVSEISWRESYIDQSSECSGSTEDLLAKLDSLDCEGNPIVRSKRGGVGGGSSGAGGGEGTSLMDNNNSASASLRKAGAAAAAALRASSPTGYSSDIKYGGGGSDSEVVVSSAVRPLQVYDIQMSTRAESPSSALASTRGLSPSGRGILVEKVEMTESPLHDREEEENPVDRLWGESQSPRKLLFMVDDEEDDDVDNDPERVTDLVDFRNNLQKNNASERSNFESSSNNGTLGLYEDVEVQIEPPTAKLHGSTTLSMVPDLLSQCETTNQQTVAHFDVKIEETIPSSLNSKSIVLNIGAPQHQQQQNTTKKDQQQTQNAKTSKSQSPQPHHEPSPEPKQILPKMFAEDGKNDNKRNSSSSSLSTSKEKKKSSKGFIIQGLGSAGKKSDKDNVNGGGGGGKDVTNGNGSTAPPAQITNGDGKEKEMEKENKKSSKPGFFERLSKIRLSSGSKNKKQKVHPKADEIHQEVESVGPPAVSSTTGPAISRPLRDANSVNGNGTAKGGGGGGGANNSSLPTNHSGVQPILKKSTSTIPHGSLHADSEEPDEATQAFENILEEIAGLKSIQLRQGKSSSSSIDDNSPSSSQQVRSFAKRKQFYTSATSPSPPVSPNSRSYSDLDSKLTQFKEDTSRTLDAISKSHPDLEGIEESVKQRQQSLSPEPPKVEVHRQVSTLPKQGSSSSGMSAAAAEAAQNSEREWYRLLKSAAEKYSYKGPKDEHFNALSSSSHKTGIVETDLDTGASREMLDEDMLQLDCKVPCYTVSTSEIPTTLAAATSTSSVSVTCAGSPGSAAKTRSLTNLSTRLPLSIAPSQFEESTVDLSDSEERAKSLEFLLDENHKSSSVPPENKLRLETRQLSEHELRIQRSLQRLNVPEWYRQHGTISSGTTTPAPSDPTQNKAGTLNILKRSEYGSSGRLAGGWTGLSTYKAPSMSSLQSNGGRSSGTLILNKSNFVRGRPATMSVSATRTSKESLMGPGSASHSPSAFERSSFTYGMPFTMTRFGQGRLSTHSGSVSPPSTPDSTTKTSSYIKKPYLGWRSQERLNAAAAAASTSAPGAGATSVPKLSIYLPPAERLAADLMASRAKSPHPPVRPPVSDRPPLPRAPPRSDKAGAGKAAAVVVDEQSPGAHSSPVISTQASSLAVVTKLQQNSSFNHPPEFSQANHHQESSQSAHRIQSTKAPDVHDSIRQVTTAINHYVNRGHEGQPTQKVKSKPGKKQAIWIESSFVGQKPPSK